MNSTQFENHRPLTKRIFIISYLDFPFPAGLSRRIEAFVENLNARNIEMQVISPIFRSSSRSPHPDSFRIDMRFLRSLGTENLAVKIAELVLFNCFAFVKILLSRRQLFAVQYESIYSFPAALLAKAFCQCVFIGDDVLIPRKLNWAVPLLRVLSCATDVMLCSTRETIAVWSDTTRTLYVPNGVPERFVLKKNRSINFERPRIVFVGTLSWHVNVRAVGHIIEISSEMPDEYEFLIVGSPVPQNLLAKRVRFLGQLDDASLLRLYDDANVGVLPFFGSPAEGPKIKILEYMAAQLLVISSPEGVEGYPGLVAWEHYVPAASVEELKRVLLNTRVGDIAGQYARIVTRAHDFALTHYRWPNLLQDYLNFVNALKDSEDPRRLQQGQVKRPASFIAVTTKEGPA